MVITIFQMINEVSKSWNHNGSVGSLTMLQFVTIHSYLTEQLCLSQ